MSLLDLNINHLLINKNIWHVNCMISIIRVYVNFRNKFNTRWMIVRDFDRSEKNSLFFLVNCMIVLLEIMVIKSSTYCYF